MIDLSMVRACLATATQLIEDLDGKELDETDAVTSQSRGELRKVKAQRSQDLQLLATRLELAGALVRNEYWYARGEQDPTRPQRRD